jgi:hypothetical protein
MIAKAIVFQLGCEIDFKDVLDQGILPRSISAFRYIEKVKMKEDLKQ